MSDIIYIPIIKTGDAEIRGIENLSDDVKDRITPLFELTRSRKSKNVPRGDIFRRLNRLEEAYGTRQFILDLTAHPNLPNEQIEALHDNRHGYKKWIEFLVSLKEHFPEIIPVIQISDEGVDSAEDFYERIQKQVESLDKNFDNIVYRFPLEYEDFKGDLAAVCQAISGDKIICVIDAGFIAQKKSNIYSEKAISVINELNRFSPGTMTLSAASFPRNPAAIGGEQKGYFRLEETFLYEEVAKKVESPLIYGDYATVNPIRSLQAGAAGWVPRIDMPTKDIIFYRRSRKGKLEASYAKAYIRVAKLVTNKQGYKVIKKKLDDCWGIKQIESAAQGYPQGLSPSFWISVRMNIHITLRTVLL